MVASRALSLIHILMNQMKKHAEILRPKFEAILQVMDQELSGLGIASWTKPNGGYFISFDAMEGCAKKIVAKANEAGLTMTGAGATYPYHNDPQDSNIDVYKRQHNPHSISALRAVHPPTGIPPAGKRRSAHEQRVRSENCSEKGTKPSPCLLYTSRCV